MAFILKRESKYFEEGARSLIKAVTGFEDDEENFEICLNFTLSNFLHHRYLDVNSHQVQRTIDGLCEKHLIHSHFEKATALRSLSTNLLENISKEESHVREAAHGVLSLLLLLSESSENDQDFTVLSDDDSTQKEEFDWAQYLLEGEEEFTVLSDEDDELWSDGDEEEDSLEEDFFSCPPRRDDSGIDVSPDSAVPSLNYVPSPDIPLPSSKQTWFLHHIRTPYWNAQHQMSHINPPSKTLASNITKEWEKHMEKDSTTEMLGAKTCLTECSVIREALWMLHGVKSSYLFVWEKNQFHVNNKVHLSHLTSNTLTSVLSRLCHYGNKVVQLHEFVKESCQRDVDSSYYCLTYQAYAMSLRSVLQQFSELLVALEKQVIAQEETLTLNHMFQRLKPHLEDLELITCIHNEGVEKCLPSSTSLERAVRLLTVLWKHLALHSTWTSISTVEIVLSLFLKTTRPYFHLLEGLVSRGWLEDRCREFVIHRKENVSILAEEFWDSGLVLKGLPPELGAEFFLKPLLSHILLAGKSMELLRNLGHLSEICSPAEDTPSGFLYSRFLLILQDFLHNLSNGNLQNGTSNANDGNVQDVTNAALSAVGSTYTEFQSHSAMIWQRYISPDPLLKRNFEDIMKCHEDCNLSTDPSNLKRIVQRLNANCLLPVNLAVQKAIHTCVMKACRVTSKKLIDILKEKYKLMTHIALMKKYFLMESGDVMFSFYSEIFHKICSNDLWQDVSFLHVALQDAIASQDQEAAERMSVFLESTSQTSLKPLCQLGCLQLVYEAQWPIEVVLNNKSQKQYCQVFCFLMQVKCAKYVLDELRFAVLQKNEDEIEFSQMRVFMAKPDMPHLQKIHGMFMLRMRLMHFVNGFHNYIMTRILHSSGLELDKALEQAENLDDVIGAHEQYLLSLHERCLLDSKLSLLREQIFRVLNLTLTFQQMWQGGIDKISLEELLDLEKEFSSCHNFLTSYLSKPLKRGAYPHLEALASALLYPVPLQRIFHG